MELHGCPGTAKPESRNWRVAFTPIVCSAPLLYAHSHGFFAREGLSVELKLAPGWSGIKELLVHGFVDAAHMLMPMPFACAMGIDGIQAPIRVGMIQNINGQAITLAKKHLGVRQAVEMKGFTFGVPYLFSMHNYLLRHWLAEHGVNPTEDVVIREVARRGCRSILRRLDRWVSRRSLLTIVVQENLGSSSPFQGHLAWPPLLQLCRSPGLHRQLPAHLSGIAPSYLGGPVDDSSSRT